MLILFMEKAFSIIFLSEFFVVCSLFILLATAPAIEAVVREEDGMARIQIERPPICSR